MQTMYICYEIKVLYLSSHSLTRGLVAMQNNVNIFSNESSPTIMQMQVNI